MPKPKAKAFFQQAQVASLKQKVAAMAQTFGVDPNLALDLVSAESSWNPESVNGQHLGLFQLSKVAVNDVSKQLLDTHLSTKEIMNPDTNIKLGVMYMALLQKQLGQNYTPARLMGAYHYGYEGMRRNNFQFTDKMKNHPNDIYRKYFNSQPAQTMQTPEMRQFEQQEAQAG